jgi:hypothetical protein
MKHIDSLSRGGAKKTKTDYQEKFGEYDIQTFKLTNQLLGGRASLAQIQAALQNGKPMNFNSFA